MFAGTKQLDKILSYGRTEKTHRGLGFTGANSMNTSATKFVSAGVDQVKAEAVNTNSKYA